MKKIIYINIIAILINLLICFHGYQVREKYEEIKMSLDRSEGNCLAIRIGCGAHIKVIEPSFIESFFMYNGYFIPIIIGFSISVLYFVKHKKKN